MQSHSSQHSTTPPQRKRRKNLKHDEEHPLMCAVCGAEAHGYNFDVITCDSCKVFFRRTANREDTSVEKLKRNCIQGHGECVITTSTRKRCPPCRMRRCLEVGMKKEWITPINQLMLRSNFSGNRSKTGRSSRGSSTKRSRSSDGDHLYTEQWSSESEQPIEQKPHHKEPTPYCNMPTPFMAATESIRAQVRPVVKVEPQQKKKVSIPANLMDSRTITFIRSMYEGWIDQVERAQEILMEPLTESDVERYNLLDRNPTIENAFNRREFGVRRLIRAFKEMPQFVLLSKATQMALVKDTMRGVSTLFFLMHFKPDTKTAAFEHITRDGELKELEISCRNCFRQGLSVVAPKQWTTLLSIFSPPSGSSTVAMDDSLNLMDVESLQELVDNYPISPSWTMDDLFNEYVYSGNIKTEATLPFSSFSGGSIQQTGVSSMVADPLPLPDPPSESHMFDDTVEILTENIEQTMSLICQSTNCDPILLTTACFLRLFRVNENAERLHMSKNDRYVIQRTRSELSWFFIQYSKHMWTVHDGALSPTLQYSPSGQVMSAAVYAPMGESTLRSLLQHQQHSPSSSVDTRQHPGLKEHLMDLNLIFERLDKIEKVKLHMEYFMHRDKITPLMREFLPENNETDITWPTS